MIATNDSSSHRPVAHHARVRLAREQLRRACRMRSSAWKPEIAPQAIVMKQNGKSCAAEDRAAAVDEPR